MLKSILDSRLASSLALNHAATLHDRKDGDDFSGKQAEELRSAARDKEKSSRAIENDRLRLISEYCQRSDGSQALKDAVELGEITSRDVDGFLVKASEIMWQNE